MRAACCVIMLAFALAPVHAQTTEKPVRVTVTVKDQSGAVIPNAQVVITEMVHFEAPYVQVMRPAVEIRGLTSAAGEAQFSLPPGKYEYSVVAFAFKPVRMPLEVTGGNDQRVAVVLELGFFSGPVLVAPEWLALIPSEALMELIPEVTQPELTLPSRSWRKSRTRR